jgi:hypothetical protein
MSRWLLPAVMALFVSAACSKDQETEQPPEPPAVPPTPPLAATASAAPAAVIGAEPTTQVPSDQLPTQEDFEPEAEQKITAANLEAALAELKGEIKE